MRLPLFIFALAFSFAAIGASAQPSSFSLNIGVVYGKVVQKDRTEPVEGATIEILVVHTDSASMPKPLLIKTTATNKRGDFYAEHLPVDAELIVHISAVGHAPYETKIEFHVPEALLEQKDVNAIIPMVNKNAGTIYLLPADTELDNITVISTRPLIEMYIDKRVYNVEKDLQATGGTAVDLMKNVPGLTVDADNNVQLRNGSPQIFVDGRPTTLSADQISADQVASIEIITNPSAKYDASVAGAGIVNIVLRKNRLAGYNGSLRANADSRGHPGIGGDINLRRKKINFFAGGMYNSRTNISKVTADRAEYSTADTIHISQRNNPILKGYLAYARAGADYFVSNKTTLSITGNFFRAKFLTDDVFNIGRDTVNALTRAPETSMRNIHADIDIQNKGSVLAMKHFFKTQGNELSADMSYYNSTFTNTSDYQSIFFDAAGNAKPSTPAEKAMGGSNTDLYAAQTDYEGALGKLGKIELGLRSVIKKYRSWNDNFLLNLSTHEFDLIPALTINYRFTDEVYAGYFTFSRGAKNIKYQAGLRAENSRYHGNLVNKNLAFQNKYPISLFPAGFVTFSINAKQELQVNYSRKINRPSFFQILPFVDFSDSLNLSVGNPALLPEFSHLAEINYINHYQNGHAYFMTAYARISKNVITRYQYKTENGNPANADSAIFNSYTNASAQTTVGIEMISRNKIAKWWDITSNLNLFDVYLRAANIPGVQNTERFSWFAKMNNTFTLPAAFSIQLSGEYQAKTILPVNTGRSGASSNSTASGQTLNLSQGYINPVYGIDIAVKKDFLKNNAASLTLQVNDIFKMRTYETFTNTMFFSQHNYRQRDAQVFRLNFSWRFGKVDAALSKRKNSKSDADSLPALQSVGQ